MTAAENRALVARLLTELGDAPELSRDLDCGALEPISQGLRLRRHALRLVELDPDTLADLSLPALVACEGELALVRKVTPRAVSLQCAGGATRTLAPEPFVSAVRGTALEIFPTLLRTGSFVTRLLDYLGRRWTDLAKLSLLSLALTAIGLTTPYATGLVVDRALPDRTPKLLGLVALVIVLVALQRALLTWLEQRATLALRGRLEAAVSTSLFDHVLRIPYEALTREDVGSWLETLHGAQQAQALVTETLLRPVLQLAMAAVYAVALARHGGEIAVALTGMALLLIALSLAFAARAARLERTMIEASARQSAGLYEILGGVFALRTSGAQQRGVMRWLDRMLEARGISVRMDRFATRSRIVLGGMREATMLGTFLWAAYGCLEGSLSVGALLSLTMIAERLITVAAGFASVLTPLLTARTHLARVDALLAHPDSTATRPRVSRAVAPQGDAVVLEDVWFRYGPDMPWILQGYSLRVPSLEHFELRGPSGMGKSTILRLIAGLYTPERGRVRVFGHPPHEVRDAICYLPQDLHLFQGSILQNLRLLSGATSEALQEAAQQSGLAEYVATLPMRYETVLPAGATNLSGGQRQLIVWTAAMASGRKLLLMDEALSQVDRLLRARLLAMARQRARTTISVEHERTRIRAPAAQRATHAETSATLWEGVPPNTL